VAIINFYKPIGWTPLECIAEIRKMHPDLQDSAITYAGRLDPMAEGVIIFLSDNDRYQKEAFQKLDKTYEATFLFGISSDTHDGLGIITPGFIPTESAVTEAFLNITGTHILPFPSYSSFKVQGKPLHWWVSQNRLNEIEIPQKEMTVTTHDLKSVSQFPLSTIRNEVLERISLVNGNFRQKECQQSWNQLPSELDYLLGVSATLTVRSGTYIRSIAQMVGTQLGCGALLYKLRRTRVGDFMDSESQHHIS